MPTYDYQCRTCGKTFEWFQSMSAEKLTHCPAEVCTQEAQGQGMVERKIGKGAGLIFNGSGFYLTDYTKSSGSSGSGSSSDSSSSSPAAAPAAPAASTSQN